MSSGGHPGTPSPPPGMDGQKVCNCHLRDVKVCIFAYMCRIIESKVCVSLKRGESDLRYTYQRIATVVCMYSVLPRIRHHQAALPHVHARARPSYWLLGGWRLAIG